MAARSSRIALVVALALGAALQACKKREAPSAPSDVGDDIAQIEAALQERDGELQRAGVVVAYREPVARDTAKAEPETPTFTEPDPDAADETPDEPPVGGPGADEPTPEPGEPTTSESAPPVEAEPMRPSADAEDAPALRSRKGAASRRRARELKRERFEVDRSDRRPRSRCERVCMLASTTCDLRDRVCTLAGEHPDDVRYEDACRRAEDQCESATRHCSSCAV